MEEYKEPTEVENQADQEPNLKDSLREFFFNNPGAAYSHDELCEVITGVHQLSSEERSRVAAYELAIGSMLFDGELARDFSTNLVESTRSMRMPTAPEED